MWFGKKKKEEQEIETVERTLYMVRTTRTTYTIDANPMDMFILGKDATPFKTNVYFMIQDPQNCLRVLGYEYAYSTYLNPAYITEFAPIKDAKVIVSEKYNEEVRQW